MIRRWKSVVAMLVICLSITAAGPAPAKRQPWESINDLPRGAWYRGVKQGWPVNVTEWTQVSSIDPPFVWVGNRWREPRDLLGRFEWTRDPYVDNPVTRPCGK